MVAHAKEDAIADDRFEQTTSAYQICCGCEKQFETEQELADHRKRDHLGVKQVPKLLKRRTCEHCHKRFRSVRKLEEHIEQYEEKAVYKCKVSGMIGTFMNVFIINLSEISER